LKDKRGIGPSRWIGKKGKNKTSPKIKGTKKQLKHGCPGMSGTKRPTGEGATQGEGRDKAAVGAKKKGGAQTDKLHEKAKTCRLGREPHRRNMKKTRKVPKSVRAGAASTKLAANRPKKGSAGIRAKKKKNQACCGEGSWSRALVSARNTKRAQKKKKQKKKRRRGHGKPIKDVTQTAITTTRTGGVCVSAGENFKTAGREKWSEFRAEDGWCSNSKKAGRP